MCGTFCRRVSYKNVKLCCDNVDNERSEKLRMQLHHYLESDPPEATVSALSFTRESAAVAARDSEIKVSVLYLVLHTMFVLRLEFWINSCFYW